MATSRSERELDESVNYVSRLTSRQQTELNEAILGYLKTLGYKDVVTIFEAESKAKFSKKQEFALERKWKTVDRLEAQIDDLEVSNNELGDLLERYKVGGKVDTGLVLPKKADQTLDQHRGAITALKFHPNIAIIGTASKDGTVKIWESDSGRYKRTLSEGGHTDSVEDLAWSPDGNLLATVSADASIKIWDRMEEYKCIKTLKGHEDTVSAVLWSHSGQFLYTGSKDATIKTWDITTGHLTKTFEKEGDFGHAKWVGCLALNQTGDRLASGSYDQTVKVWDLKTSECTDTFRDHTNTVTSVAFSLGTADQFIIQSILEDQDQASANAAKAKLGLTDPANDPGGMFLFSTSRDRSIRCWFLTEGVCVKVIKAHDNWVNSVIFQPSGRYILTASDDKTIRVFDLAKGARCCRKLANIHKAWVMTLDWNRSFARLASGDKSGKVKLWHCTA